MLDVFFAYRLILGRFPERTDIDFLLDRTVEFPSVSDLARAFHTTDEYHFIDHGTSFREDGRVVLVRDGDLRIAVDLDDRSIGWGIINGEYEPETRRLIERLTPQGGFCLDLGANVGFFTAIMARAVGEQGRVVAYEPFPRAHRMAAITLAESGLSDRVSLRRKACSDTPAQMPMFFAAETDNFGGMFVSANVDPDNTPLQHVEVEVTTVDEELTDERRVDLIKMDVEGAELRALRGMERRLANDRPVIITEINVSCLAREGVAPDEILEFFRDRDYRIHIVSEGDYALTLVEGAYTKLGDESIANVLCVPLERSESVARTLAPDTDETTENQIAP